MRSTGTAVPVPRFGASRAMRWLVPVLSALVVAAGACSSSDGGSNRASTGVQSPATTARAPHDVTGLVDIGGGRRIFVKCRGVGSPTVVLISGKGNGAEDWQQVLDRGDPAHQAPGDDVGAGLGKQRRSPDAVFPSVARFTRVCAYDRPDTRIDGADRSTPRPQPHPVDLAVTDLHKLLTAIGGPEPYVLVPHSYGGFIAELYARRYPTTVAGLVMVDAADQLIADVVSPAKLANWDQTNRATSAQVQEGVEVADAINQINAAPPMPKMPTIILSADKPPRTDLLPPDATQGDKLVTFAEWLAHQALLARALGAKHITQTNSGHNIYLYSPALVTNAIHEIVNDIRDHSTPKTN